MDLTEKGSSMTTHSRLFRLAGVCLALVIALTLAGQALADFSYTVKPGDNLSKIARNTGTTVDALVAANKTQYPCLAKNPGCLQIGWVITIPGGGSSGVVSSGPSTYTVAAGDSLAKIAKKLGVDFNALIAANKTERPCLAAATPCALQIGWVLQVPAGATLAADDPKAIVVEYIAAINARDVERFKATIHPDLQQKSPDFDQAVRELFTFFDAVQIHYEIVSLQVLEQTDTRAVVAYTFRGSSPLPNTNTATASGKFTLLKYQGGWRIASEEFVSMEVTP